MKSMKLELQLIVIFSMVFAVVNGVAQLPNSEVEGLRNIAKTLGKTDWNFSVDPCSGESGWATSIPANSRVPVNAVFCDCSYVNNTVCHVVSIFLRRQNLPGMLPPELVQLPYLQVLELFRNYLNGSIPREWASLPLVTLQLTGNRISGPIPVEFTNITTLKNFTLEFNQVSGSLPEEFGNMVNLERILISSNNFTGPLPETLAKLTNLKDFRISDNHFTGRIPNYIQNWTNLTKIVIQASGLQGPIPSEISTLTKITDIRISDLNGTEFPFPPLSNMESLQTLILKSCNITGVLPAYLGNMFDLRNLYLTGNELNGPVPEWMVTNGDNMFHIS